MKKVYLISVIIAVLALSLYVFYSEYGYKFKLVKPIYKTTQVYSKTVDNSNLDTIWCGTFQLAWNELMDYTGGIVEFENTESVLAKQLNERTFTKDMLSDNSYYIKMGKATEGLKKEIDNDLKSKFNIDGTNIFDGNDLNDSHGILIYSMLKKNFTFVEKFDDLDTITFKGNNQNTSNVKVFGIDKESDSKLCDNVEVLYWDPNNVDSNLGLISNECAVKLKTKENEEVILYKTDKDDTFENLYMQLQSLSETFEGNKKFSNVCDELRIPSVNIDINISYDELCNKIMKNTDGEYISKAIQNIKFNLNSEGGLIFSEAGIITDALSAPSTNSRLFYFDKPFIIFVKEKDKEKPYFAMKINNAEYLQIEK